MEWQTDQRARLAVGAGGVQAYDLAYLSKRAARNGGLYDEE
jgi:hypothetical protein